jgi:aminoglycoside/choline kinase family phosphotransferase
MVLYAAPVWRFSAGFPEAATAMTEPIRIPGIAAGTDEPAAWLDSVGFMPREIEPLPGDVSPRRYFRAVLADGGSAILATYPPEVRSTCPRFLRTTSILEGIGVRVPRVLASDCEAGWMLVEDLGPRTLGDWGRGRPWSEIQPIFEQALEIADRISRLPQEGLAELNPVLDRELLATELWKTWDLFLEPKGLVSDPALAAELREALDRLCENLGAEEPVPCHRDFMVRNLMLGDGVLAVLDHQDLRLGPPFYDVASLLNDTLFPPPQSEAALLGPLYGDPRYHRAAAQRTLKAVGTYASFALRGANRHLPLIPPTLARFVDHFARIPEGAALAGRLAEVWRPVLGPPAH